MYGAWVSLCGDEATEQPDRAQTGGENPDAWKPHLLAELGVHLPERRVLATDDPHVLHTDVREAANVAALLRLTCYGHDNVMHEVEGGPA